MFRTKTIQLHDYLILFQYFSIWLIVEFRMTVTITHPTHGLSTSKPMLFLVMR